MNSKFIKVSNVEIPDSFYNRIKTNVESIDHLFGDGILPGCTYTLTAGWGMGKTQLMLQLLSRVENVNKRVGYITNEESVEQLAFTCRRISVHNVMVANMSNITEIAEAMKDFDVVVIDSFSMLTSDEHVGSLKIESEALDTIIAAAKANNCATFFIMHYTKDGKGAKGSSKVPHLVDANLYIEKVEGEDEQLRRVYFIKNRFGAPNEINIRLTSTGYDFTLIEGSKSPEGSKKKTNKKAKQEEDMKSIMALKEPPSIKVGRVMKLLNCEHYKAAFYLRELTMQGKLAKYGRGLDASWKIVNTVKEYV